MPEPPGRARHVVHIAPPMVPAIDLGGSTVLKPGGVFLLTDRAGDVVPDERGLGMYVGDTRMLSRLTLLVGWRSGEGVIAVRLPDRARPARRATEPRSSADRA